MIQVKSLYHMTDITVSQGSSINPVISTQNFVPSRNPAGYFW